MKKILLPGKEEAVEIGTHTQQWHHYLYMVASTPTRFVGLAPTDTDFTGPFFLYGAAQYLCNIQMRPQGQNGVQLVPIPHGVMPYDLIDVLDKVLIARCDHVVKVSEQSERFQLWMYQNYVSLFDQPRIVQPDLPPIVMGNGNQVPPAL